MLFQYTWINSKLKPDRHPPKAMFVPCGMTGRLQSAIIDPFFINSSYKNKKKPTSRTFGPFGIFFLKSPVRGKGIKCFPSPLKQRSNSALFRYIYCMLPQPDHSTGSIVNQLQRHTNITKLMKLPIVFNVSMTTLVAFPPKNEDLSFTL